MSDLSKEELLAELEDLKKKKRTADLFARSDETRAKVELSLEKMAKTRKELQRLLRWLDY